MKKQDKPLYSIKSAMIAWRFKDAPEEYQALSDHGGDEDWVIFIPDAMKDEHGEIYIPWTREGTSFGYCSVSEHEVDGGIVRIGAHA